MSYRVEHDSAPREQFGAYKYRIYRDNVLVAYFWHDYRGDDNGIDFVRGFSENSPLGSNADFLEGGGPMPLVLSKRAVAYIQGKLT